MIRRPLIAATLLLGPLLHPAAGRAAPASLESLLQNSPFGGQAGAAAGAKVDATLEFRGVLVDRGEQFFSLYEASSHSSLWVGMNEPGNPFKVQSYDGAKATVNVEYQGRTLTLPLKQAKIVALASNLPNGPNPNGPPGTPNGPMVTGGPGTGGPQSMVASGSPAEDASRLAAIAEEIRRRRALRQQAPQPVPQAGPSAGKPVPAPPRN